MAFSFAPAFKGDQQSSLSPPPASRWICILPIPNKQCKPIISILDPGLYTVSWTPHIYSSLEKAASKAAAFSHHISKINRSSPLCKIIHANTFICENRPVDNVISLLGGSVRLKCNIIYRQLNESEFDPACGASTSSRAMDRFCTS